MQDEVVLIANDCKKYSLHIDWRKMPENLMWIIITLAIGITCGLIAQKLKIPSGGIVGAMTGVLVLNFATGKTYMPMEMRTMCQMLSGALIGCQITRKDIHDFRKIIFPTSLLLLGMFLINISSGFFLHIYGFDYTTAFFASTPGGVTDMALIADELGADTTYVSILQLSRLIGIIIIMPALLRHLYRKGKITASPDLQTIDNAGNYTTEMSKKKRALRIGGSLLVAVLGGVLGVMVGLPAGAMVGALLFTATFSVTTHKAYFPTKIRPVVRILVGTFVGTRMQVSLNLLVSCIVPIIIVLVSMVIVSMLIGYTIHRITKLELGVCLFACAPAGMQEMTLMAQELGLDPAKVAVMHLFRLATVISLFPTLLNLLLHIRI